MFWKAVEYWVCIMSTKNTYLEFPLTHMDIRVEFNSVFSKTKKNVSFPTDAQMLRFHVKNTHLNSGGYFISQVLTELYSRILWWTNRRPKCRIKFAPKSAVHRSHIEIAKPRVVLYKKHFWYIYSFSKARASFSIILDVLERCMHVVLYSVDKKSISHHPGWCQWILCRI